MTAQSIHKIRIQEHLQELEDAIAIGIEQRSATLGLHISACAIDLLELYLHVLNKISAGAMVKHEWFKAPRQGQKIEPLAERKLPVQFSEKEKIFSLLYEIEERRNKLIYGNPSIKEVEIALHAFQELHKIIKEKLQEGGIEIA